MNDRYKNLLGLLCDGEFHSGEELGAAVGVSRAAVWKRLRALAGLGVELHAVRGRGYRLPRPIEFLSKPEILAALPARHGALIDDLEIVEQIDSTNRRLLAKAARGAPAPSALLAELQSQGRGRRGRRWVSPYAGNIYLSLLWRFEMSPDSLAGVGVAVGVAVARALRISGLHDVGLKWPNDVVWRGAKLAGILLELSGEVCGACQVVVGVGVNVRMPPAAGREIDQPWVDLETALGGPVSRNLLSAGLLQQLVEALQEYQARGLAPFLDEWRRQDAFVGKRVAVQTSGAAVCGIARGIDGLGALLVEDRGAVRRYFSGDVSLRAAP